MKLKDLLLYALALAAAFLTALLFGAAGPFRYG